jgi:hypothetical protein
MRISGDHRKNKTYPGTTVKKKNKVVEFVHVSDE